MSTVNACDPDAQVYRVPAEEALWRIGAHPALYCLEAELGSGPVFLRRGFAPAVDRRLPSISRVRR